MAGIYSIGGSAGHRYAGWLSEVEAKNFTFGGKVFNGSPSAIYVGSKMVWMLGWLTKAAKQAIIGAFGERDGMAVINATNAYLNQLAASDRDKATALAGFINEDPMMVCSLGLQPQGVTMPIRKVISNGNGYLRTSIKEENLYGLKFGMRVNGNKSAWASYVGGTLDNFTIGARDAETSNAYIRFRTGEVTQGLQTSTSKLVEYEFIGGKIKVDGTQKFTYSGTPFSTASSTYITLGNNGNGSRPNYCSFSHAELYDSQNNEHQYLPFVREGVVGMINIGTNTMAGIGGTWTIGYELPDGTPWTPSTP